MDDARIPDERDSMTRTVAFAVLWSRAQMQVRNQLCRKSIEQGQDKREQNRTEQSYKGARPCTRSISSNLKLQTLGPSRARSAGTMSVVGPLVCVAFASLAGRRQLPMFCSPTTVRERSVYQKIGGNER